MTTMQQYRLRRPGDIDLIFDGVLLAEESSKDEEDQEFWQEVRIYRTSEGKYVAETVGRTSKPGGFDRPTIRIAQNAAGLRDALKRKTPEGEWMTNLAVDALHAAGKADSAVAEHLTENTETVVLKDVYLQLDMELFTKQRVAVLAAIKGEEAIGDGVGKALEGVLSLLDYISDEAEDAGELDPEDRRRWWREACIAYGLGDPDDTDDG